MGLFLSCIFDPGCNEAQYSNGVDRRKKSNFMPNALDILDLSIGYILWSNKSNVNNNITVAQFFYVLHQDSL